ncbi:Flowering-promoting factor 1-like protein 3 [Sesamum angolense]|uniref:Flowering-promoting factor 1-like protein 3 n=1 Tax=Sesamum angolense TaxID=2727404 RepID=A0AAE2C1R7_9LAMI|nr:Flowering-promoting factor 1-like protein 3 [Sesamum angolense]
MSSITITSWPNQLNNNYDKREDSDRTEKKRLMEELSYVWCLGVQKRRCPAGENAGDCHGKKVLVHLPTNEVIKSYSVLERKLSCLGWERYYEDPELLQFHKRSTVHLISLPKDFNKFKSMHMYDIVVKNRNEFEVRDM